ncbi:hypothetical protein KSF_011470 [Reticulibacter mediterranei]|uniref:Uncharacterized protein n=1 Tax=Reticulibacter mediterranei TaxID=2778369 RepID=A0A8J3IH10_9CHLR|nr:hypothetical protein [Reticulibacter mediterranei]GHO91099.1 hypothetical protein KSF_011470 [Reticulibacter mediterranei]
MDDRHAEYMDQLVKAVETQPGETPESLRNRVILEAVRLQEAPQGLSDELPSAIQSYITKVALHAYRVTDEDVKGLQEIGYGEDAILEITLSTALGAGLARLQRGLAALQGANDAQQTY